MNAIISLCHFCEAHGPSAVFSTQTLRDSKIDEHLFRGGDDNESSHHDNSPQHHHHHHHLDHNSGGGVDDVRKDCAACQSIGTQLGMLSHDGESNANFLSSQVPVLADAARMVRAAATRSLSCEVSGSSMATSSSSSSNANNNNQHHSAASASSTTSSTAGSTTSNAGTCPPSGLVFFGDATHGHCLAHTFHIRDAQARGFFRLFAIVALMKDKSYLLNVQPFLGDAMHTVSRRLQDYAFATFTAEQSAAAQSERAKRLTAGQANTQAPRSLAALTGEPHIFGQLHAHFAWLLWSGARCLRETVALGCATVPPWIDSRETAEGFAMVRMDREMDWRRHGSHDGRRRSSNADDDYDDDEEEEEDVFTMRDAKELLGTEFVAACYCAIVGLQIVLRGPQTKTARLMRCLQRLLPARMHDRQTRSNSTKFVSAGECRLLSVMPEVAVPQPQANIFRVDFVRDVANDEVCLVKWTGSLPHKLPDLLLKIVKAVDERLFNDYVLNKHLNLLVEEWKNKISCLVKITSNQELAKMKKILGVQQQDQALVNYWSLGI